jgi:hypothetical protein
VLSRSSPSTPASAKRCCHRHSHRTTVADRRGDLLHGKALGRGQDNPRTLDMLVRPIPGGDDRFQPLAI